MDEASGTDRTAELQGPAALSVAWQQDGDVHRVAPHGELDVASAPALDAELHRVESLAPTTIVLDLSGLTFLDSTGIRLLVAAHERALAQPHAISFLAGPPVVQRVIEMSGLDAVLSFAG